jgi:RHS repeat-associated protein
MIASNASNTTQGPASIAELARTLSVGFDQPGVQTAADLVYEYIKNNIEFIPTYGVQKGALGCLIDGFGNSFDQAALMVETLRELNYTASYELGQITLTPTQVQNWLGVDTSDHSILDALLTNGGIPHTVSHDQAGALTSVTMHHMWVKVQFNQNTSYVFDPSFKSYTYSEPVAGLDTILGYDRATFLSQAQSGATITADYVDNINRGNIRNNLTTYSSNLVAWLKANAYDWHIDNVLGGRQIDIYYSNVTQMRDTALSYHTQGDQPTEYTGDIPTSFDIDIRVEIPVISIDETFSSRNIYGKQLALSTTTATYLKLDGTVVASGPLVIDSFFDITITVTHKAYPTTFADETITDGVYAPNLVIGTAFGSLGRGMADLLNQRNNQSRDKFEGYGSVFSALASQVSMKADLLDRLGTSKTVIHHLVGLFGQSWGYVTNIPLAQMSTSNLIPAASLGIDPDAFKQALVAQVPSLTRALRSSIQGVPYTPIEQSQWTHLDTATSLGIRVFDATSTNWSSAVQPFLVMQPSTNGYQSSTVSRMATDISNGMRLAVPQKSITLFPGGGPSAQDFDTYAQVDAFKGGYMGFFIIDRKYMVCPEPGLRAPQLQGVIWDGYPFPWDFPGSCGPYYQILPVYKKPVKDCRQNAGDPVNIFTGAYNLQRNDMSVGSGEFPYSLTFGRTYRSSNNTQSGTLGCGWQNDFELTAKKGTDSFQALGEDGSPLDAAVAITNLYVVADILSANTSLPLANFMTVSSCQTWYEEQLVENVVILDNEDGTQVYTKLPDGSFNPPPREVGTLSVSGGLFTYTSPQQVKMNFNSRGDISTWVFPNGMTVTFTYNSSTHLLQTVSNGLGRTLTLSYGNINGRQNCLVGVSDGNGRSISYSYENANGPDSGVRLSTFTDAEGKDTTYTYTAEDRLESVFYPAFPTTPFVTNYYDSLGRVMQQTHENEEINYYLNGYRNSVLDAVEVGEVKYLDRLGNAYWERDGVKYYFFRLYDALGRLIEEYHAPNFDHRTRYTYDHLNNVTEEREIAATGSGLADIVKTWTYHAVFNKPTSFTDGNGNTTSYTLDATTGNLLTITRPTVDSQVPTVNFTYNSRGQLTSREDETGIVTQYVYDSSTEKLLSVIRDSGDQTHLNLTVSYGYDNAGNVTNVQDRRGNSTSLAFDDQRRLISKTDPMPFGYLTNFAYDENGNLTSVQRQTGVAGHPWQIYGISYNVMNQKRVITDPAGHTVEYQYDDHHRLRKIIQQVGAETFRTSTFAYDEDDRVYTVTDPANALSETRTYTPSGKLFQIADGRNNVTEYEYDGLQRLAITWYPDNTGEFNWLYDQNSNVLQYYTRTTNQLIEFGYDALNRLTTKSPDGQPTVTFRYDLAGRRTLVSTPSVTGNPSFGDFQFFFDAAGRFYKETTPDSKDIVRELDENGNVTKLKYPDGYYVDYTFDEMNRMTDVRLNGSMSSAAHFSYDELSRRSALTFGNGAVTNYGLEWNDDLTSLEHAFNASDTVTFTYGFNAVHQLTSQSMTDDSFMWHPGSSATIGFTANDVNEYTEVNSVSYSYNGNGCLTNDGTWAFDYDAENHLLSASATDISASYTYDGSHRQIQKEVNSAKTRFVYDGWRRIADYDGSDVLQNRYVYGVGLDEPLIQVSSSGTLTYMHADRLGSIICTTDGSGNVSNERKFSMFGRPASFSGPDFGFTGQRYDAETGLYYCKARHYSPSLGRFLQPDPTGSRNLERNLYTYCTNDPLNCIDALGLQEATLRGLTVGGWEGAAIGFLLDLLLWMLANGLGEEAGKLISKVVPKKKNNDGTCKKVTDEDLKEIERKHGADALPGEGGKFRDDFGREDIRRLINETLEHPDNVEDNTQGRPGKIYEKGFNGERTGTDSDGFETDRVRVVHDKTTGKTITAFPF